MPGELEVDQDVSLEFHRIRCAKLHSSLKGYH